MGTGIYKWPLELAAEIAVKELAKSEFKQTTMNVVDHMTRSVYERAYNRLK
tara:strand:+ start:776 stop:928 length:153 start_codon:yes stop_codon:yes gene_type:complete